MYCILKNVQETQNGWYDISAVESQIGESLLKCSDRRKRMFDEFDKYISEFAVEDFAIDFWYDEGVDIAENMICE